MIRSVNSGVILTLSLLFCAMSGTYQNTLGVEIKYSLRPTNTTLREPVSITVEIVNHRSDPVVIDFGAQGEQNFAISIERPDGKTVKAHAPIREGFGPPGDVKIGPEQTYVKDLLVPNLLAFDVPGTYRIGIRITSPILSGGQVVGADPGADLKLEVGPADQRRLQASCVELAETISTARTYPEAETAAKALSTINDEIAIPYLKRAAAVWHLDAITVPAITRIGGSAAVDALVELLHAGSTDTKQLARSGLAQIENASNDPQLKNRIRSEVQLACKQSRALCQQPK